jgi:hypothetical protein
MRSIMRRRRRRLNFGRALVLNDPPTLSALSQCRSMRRLMVSIPCRNIQELSGEIHAPTFRALHSSTFRFTLSRFPTKPSQTTQRIPHKVLTLGEKWTSLSPPAQVAQRHRQHTQLVRQWRQGLGAGAQLESKAKL